MGVELAGRTDDNVVAADFDAGAIGLHESAPTRHDDDLAAQMDVRRGDGSWADVDESHIEPITVEWPFQPVRDHAALLLDRRLL